MDTGSSPAPHWQSKPHRQSGTDLPDGRGTVATEATWLDRVDGYQQSHRWLAIPFAVFRKFIDDQAGSLAALIAYYGFFALFSLRGLIVLVYGFAADPFTVIDHMRALTAVLPTDVCAGADVAG